MARDKSKRKAIFYIYSQNIKMLAKIGLIDSAFLLYPDIYICPLCLDIFQEDALDEKYPNQLTFEDVPPISLGGSANILTCKACNSRCGHDIDVHLVNRIIQLKNKQFLPGSSFDAFIEKDDLKLQAKVTIDDQGGMSVFHSKSNNNPYILEQYVNSIKEKTDSKIVSLEIRGRKLISIDRLQVALLKISYLLAFKEFGYLFILSPYYNLIRKQILTPSQNLFPYKFWDVNQFGKELIGTFIVKQWGMESIFSIFPLEYEEFSLGLTTFLPLPISTDPMGMIIHHIRKVERVNTKLKFTLELLQRLNFVA